jgi:hypothetical protein
MSYWLLHGKNYVQAIEKLNGLGISELIETIINDRYNNFLRELADYKDGETPIDPAVANGIAHGKRIPYMGWFWRAVDFANKDITIGFDDSSKYVGIMENNKWYYDERKLTDVEVDHLLQLIDNAMRINERGGDVDQIIKDTKHAIELIYPWMQGLTK